MLITVMLIVGVGFFANIVSSFVILRSFLASLQRFFFCSCYRHPDISTVTFPLDIVAVAAIFTAVHVRTKSFLDLRPLLLLLFSLCVFVAFGHSS